MRLYEVIRVYEARRNPEQNPRINPIDALRKYKDDPNIFISFQGITKTGINPNYPWENALGFYFYPLSKFWEQFQSDLEAGRMPRTHGANARYIFVVKYNGKGKRIINNISDYTSADLQHDIELLQRKGYKIPKPSVYSKYARNEFEKLNSIVSKLTSHIPEPLSGADGPKLNRRALAMNTIFRELGYAYINEPDGPGGSIHEMEAYQGFFTSGAYIKTIEMIDVLPGLVGEFGIPSPSVWTPKMKQQLNPYLPFIKSHPFLAVDYAAKVLQKRWLAMEPLIMSDEGTANLYTRFVLSKDPEWKSQNAGKLTDQEIQMVKTDDADGIIEYAVGSKGGRWVEAEPYILKRIDIAAVYADKILSKDPVWSSMGGRWPELEQQIIEQMKNHPEQPLYMQGGVWGTNAVLMYIGLLKKPLDAQAQDFIKQIQSIFVKAEKTIDLLEFANSVISKDPDWFYKGGRWPELEHRMVNDPVIKNMRGTESKAVSLYIGAVKRPFDKEMETFFNEVKTWALRNSHAAVRFAEFAIKGRFPEAEPRVMKYPMFAVSYAEKVLSKDPKWTKTPGHENGRWPEAEPYIMTNPSEVYNYATQVIKGRWKEAEPYIKKDKTYWRWYKEHFNMK